MSDPLKETYCCCQMLPFTHGVFLIAFHSFLQGAYGILVILTSYYKNGDFIINMINIAANICMFPAGIVVFGTTLYESYHAARFSAFLFTIVTVFNFGAATCYLFWYNEFGANSQLDKLFFWRNNHDWVDAGQLPFTIWHILTYTILVVLMIWWYYSFQLWKYAGLVKAKNDAVTREFEPVVSFFSRKRRKSSA